MPEFLVEHWAMIAGAVAAIFGYGRLNQRVTNNANAIKKLDADISRVLRDIRDDVKSIHHKVDQQKDVQHQMHVDLLDRLSK